MVTTDRPEVLGRTGAWQTGPRGAGLSEVAPARPETGGTTIEQQRPGPTAGPGHVPTVPTRVATVATDADAAAVDDGPPVMAVDQRPGYLPALDGLRAVAVAAVVAYHLGRLPGGFLGVDVFFVISGFLITKLLLAERDRTGAIALGAFWVRRFRRLLPALLVVVPVTVAASRLWLPSWRLGDIRTDALSALAYVANWRFVASGQSYFDAGIVPSPLRHTWSLAIEEQFYVLWPLVVVAVVVLAGRRARPVVAVLAGAATVASAVWMATLAGAGGDLSRIYYGTDTRAFALLAGALLATGWDPGLAMVRSGGRRRRRRLTRTITWVGGLALVPLAVLIVGVREDVTGTYRGGFQAAAVLSVLVVAGLAAGNGAPTRLLSGPVPRWIGRRSYGIYLWSWPTQVMAADGLGVTGWRLDLAVVVVTVALAAVSFRLVEEPARTGTLFTRRLASRPRGGPPLALGHRLAPGAISLVAVVVIVVGTTAGSPDPPDFTTTSDDQALAAALDTTGGFDGPAPEAQPTTSTTSTVPVTEPDRALARSMPDDTVPPVPPGPPGPFDPDAPIVVTEPGDPIAVHGRPLRVLITGDSVGWSLAWDLDPATVDGVQFSNRALIGCGILPVEGQWDARGIDPQPYGPDCHRQAEIEDIGLQEGPDVVLLWAGAWEVYDQIIDGTRYRFGSTAHTRLVEDRLQERIDRYRAAGYPTVTPLVTCFGDTPARLGTERADADRLAWLRERWEAVALRNRGWVRLIDPAPHLCDDEGRAIERTVDGIEIRPDGAHFDEGSRAWFWNTYLSGAVAGAYASG